MPASQELPTLSEEAIAVNIVFTFFMLVIAIWRLVVRFRVNPRLGWSDYWMIVAVICGTAAHSWSLVPSVLGIEGMLDADPRANPDNRKKVLFLHFIGGALNMYTMFFAKMSICHYLLGLDFSRAYRHMIYASMCMVVVLNFVLPFVSHWFYCRPLKAAWDSRVKDPKCMPTEFRVSVTYIAGASHVITDILYSAAPVIYLNRVQLNGYTKWGIRMVFLCAMIGTGVSIAKPIQFARLGQRPRPKNSLRLATITNLLSVVENSFCIIVACLPPLRRTFDNLLRKVLPSSVLDKMGATQQPADSFKLPTYYSRKSVLGDEREDDTESATAILPDEEYIVASNGQIVKSTKVVVNHEPADVIRMKQAIGPMQENKGNGFF